MIWISILLLLNAICIVFLELELISVKRENNGKHNTKK